MQALTVAGLIFVAILCALGAEWQIHNAQFYKARVCQFFGLVCAVAALTMMLLVCLGN